MRFTGFALETTVHFISEKRSEPYKEYGEASITCKKCAGDQEHFHKKELVSGLERCGA